MLPFLSENDKTKPKRKCHVDCAFSGASKKIVLSLFFFADSLVHKWPLVFFLSPILMLYSSFLFGCVHVYMHNIIWVQRMAESRVPNCFSHTYIGHRKVFSLHCSGHFWLLSMALLPIKLVLSACNSACTVELYWLDPIEKIYKGSGEARTWMYNASDCACFNQVNGQAFFY